MPGPIGDRLDYIYPSDDGKSYTVNLSKENGLKGGFTEGEGADGKYPYGVRNMRHVYGVATDGTRSRLPISSNTATLYKTGGTFNKYSKDFDIQGRIGEHMS